jgi:hypothetical protein
MQPRRRAAAAGSPGLGSALARQPITDDAIVYLRRPGNDWAGLTLGTAIDPRELGIPEQAW